MARLQHEGGLEIEHGLETTEDHASESAMLCCLLRMGRPHGKNADGLVPASRALLAGYVLVGHSPASWLGWRGVSKAHDAEARGTYPVGGGGQQTCGSQLGCGNLGPSGLGS